MRVHLLLLLGAMALLAPSAAALPAEGQVGPTPLCDVLGSALACSAVWYHTDPEAGLRCLVLAQPTTACTDTSCTLNHPPSRCGNVFAQFGFRRGD